MRGSGRRRRPAGRRNDRQRAALQVVVQPARIASAMLRIRDGKVVHWREYQDTFAILQAMTQP
jgi:limonene-1,2-epoxide hydrolase